MPSKHQNQIIKIDEADLEAAIAATNSEEIDLKPLFKVAMAGDLSSLTMRDKMMLYASKAKSMGIDPMTQPFDLIESKGKQVLYPNAKCAAELQRIHGVSLGAVRTQMLDKDLVQVEITATLRNGRTDSDIGIVQVGDRGISRGDAIMKAATKAKRRVTFSILGMSSFVLEPDEMTEIPVMDATVDQLHGVEYMSAEDLAALCELGKAAGFSDEMLGHYFRRKFPNRPKSELDKQRFDEVVTELSNEAFTQSFISKFERDARMTA